MFFSFALRRPHARRAALYCALFGSLLASGPWARATESGASVYPAGVDTVLPGLAPPPGASMLCEFNNLYQANRLADGAGHSVVPGFHLRVAAFAVKFTHNWGVHLLGGTLTSYAALPFLSVHLEGPFGTASKAGFSNAGLQPVAIAYQHGPWNWWYGFDVFLPASSYRKNDLVQVGQHNFAGAPTGAFTYLPDRNTEISSKVQYIVNGANNQTHYRSGHELIWEYDAMRNVKKVAVGVNGYYYQQTTHDLQNGVTAGDGFRGRDFAVGPEVRWRIGKLGLVAKYQRDTLVENRAAGNSLWFQVGLPVGHGHE